MLTLFKVDTDQLFLAGHSLRRKGEAMARRTLLTEDEIQARLGEIPAWKREGKTISRTWKFRDFPESLAFINKVGALAESMNHHPDIYNSWATVRLVLTTHYKGGLTNPGIDLLRQLENKVRGAPPFIRRGQKPDPRPGILNVRMMVHRLGEGTDLVDEREGFRKIAELPRAGDRLPFLLPGGNLAQSRLDLVLRQQGSSGHCVAFSAKAMTRQKELVGINLE